MEEMEQIRHEALRGMVILAIHDPVFRSGAITNLEDTLERYAIVLNERERSEVNDFREGIANRSDEDILLALREELEEIESGAERQ